MKTKLSTAEKNKRIAAFLGKPGDFFNKIEDAYEMENRLDNSEGEFDLLEEYTGHLKHLVLNCDAFCEGDSALAGMLFHAAPQHRAEAFGQVMKLWS